MDKAVLVGGFLVSLVDEICNNSIGHHDMSSLVVYGRCSHASN